MSDDEDFILRSARLVNFEFRVTKEVEVYPDFVVIKDDTTNLVNKFKKDLKTKIMETLEIEIALLKKHLYDNLAKNIDRVVVTSIYANGKDYTTAHDIVSTILHLYSDEFLSLTDVTVDEFYEIYKAVHSLDAFPIIPIPTGDELDTEDTEMHDSTIVPATPVSPDKTTRLPPNHNIFVTTTQRAKQEQETLAQPYKTALFRTFNNPMKIYFERSEAVKIDNTHRRFHEETVLTDSTTATETRLGLE